MGDFNSRTGTLDDFIDDDVILWTVTNETDSLFTYDSDAPPQSRVSPDRGHNEY